MRNAVIRILALSFALLLLGSTAILPTAADGMTVAFEEAFDDYESGVNASATRLSDFFNVDANAIGDGYVKVEEDAKTGNLYLKNHVFTQAYSKAAIETAYEFSLTAYEMQGGHQAGMFFRAPACECAYYEADGSDADNPNSTGRSGIWVFVYRDRIAVNIKAYDSTKPNKVASLYHSFPLPENSVYDNGIVIRIVDSGADAQIYADGTLLCNLLFSEETGRKWLQNGIDRSVYLYKTVTMLDAGGTELLVAENTFVSAGQSVIGWATRASDMRLDNVRVMVQAPAETDAETDSATEIATMPETERKPETVTDSEMISSESSSMSETEVADTSDPSEVDSSDSGSETAAGATVKTVDDSLAVWILIAVMLVAIGVTTGVIAIKRRDRR